MCVETFESKLCHICLVMVCMEMHAWGAMWGECSSSQCGWSASQADASCRSVVEQTAAACCGEPVGIHAPGYSAMPGGAALGPGSWSSTCICSGMLLHYTAPAGNMMKLPTRHEHTKCQMFTVLIFQSVPAVYSVWQRVHWPLTGGVSLSDTGACVLWCSCATWRQQGEHSDVASSQ